ncbi:MAG: triose-phosphate isomerase [Gammaproteobacteria bacterium]|nr:triose-phosphate isomerase [Gammaproteobacteria bacterium]
MAGMIVAGNWKMNASKNTVTLLLNGLKQGEAKVANAELVVFPPFPYLAQVQMELSGTNIRIGVQNICAADKGAYTGEVSLAMAKEFGVSYALVGHSERRALYAESDAQVAAKYIATQAAQLTPILCVGETLEQREKGLTLSVVTTQIQAVIDAAGGASFTNAVIAYEPVWAIGTGLTATPQQAQEVHQAIRAHVASVAPQQAASLKILYGGSVTAASAEELFAQADIDGGLVGGASLQAESFLAIGQSAK